MATAGASPGGVFEGCIAAGDTGVERRPYHRNCGCALHDRSRAGACSHAHQRTNRVSYPMRRSWSEGSLALAAAGAGASSGRSSPSNNSSSSPALAVAAARSTSNLMALGDVEEEEDSCMSPPWKD